MREINIKRPGGPAPDALPHATRRLLDDMTRAAYQQGRDDADADKFPALIVGLVVGAACSVPLVIIASHLLRH